MTMISFLSIQYRKVCIIFDTCRGIIGTDNNAISGKKPAPFMDVTHPEYVKKSGQHTAIANNAGAGGVG